MTPPAEALGVVGAAARDVLLRLSFALGGGSESEAIHLYATRAAIDDALRALRAWAETDPAEDEHVEALDEAIARVVAARQRAALEQADLERPLAGVEEALRRERERALDRLGAAPGRRMAARAPTGAPFRASVGVPAVHRVWRKPEPPPAEPATDERSPTPDELIASAREAEPVGLPGEAPEPPSAPERAHEGRLASACLERIAGLSRQRRGVAEVRWDSVARIEEEMLACLDALVALTAPAPYQLGGEPFDLRGAVLRYAAEVHADEGRAFTCAFVLGCVDDEGAIRDAVLAIHRRHRACLDAAREGLVLASSPSIRGALAGLVHAADAALASFAIDVLGARREVDLGDLVVLLAHPDAGVAASAARALGRARERDAAAAELEVLAREAGDDRTLVAAIEGLAGLGAEAGAARARERLREALGDRAAAGEDTVLALAEVLALVGAAEDLPLVQAACAGTARGAQAMGWFGHPAIVPALVEELARENRTHDERAWNRPGEHAAAVALFRILGEDPLGAAAPEGGLVPMEPTIDAAAWAELWSARAPHLGRVSRCRFGRPYTPSQSLDEVQSPLAGAPSRAFAALELRALTRGRAELDPADWIARQRLEIARLAEIVAGLPERPGEFVGERLRRREG